jgi:recombination protein RecA
MAKKVKEETIETKSKLEATLDNLNKKYGVGTILTLDSKTQGDYDVISSGSIGFDYITLGVGGFVKGKLYELVGWEGSGKSTICGHAAAECQKKGGKVAYIDGEHAVDKNYFQSLGVNTQNMFIAQPSCGEEGFNIAVELIQTGEIDLIIIDSDSSLIPKAVLDGEVGDSSIGKKARLNSGAYPKIKSLLADNKVCMIVVSQYREKIGVMFGDPRTTQGGHALKFYTDCRIEVSKSLTKDGDVNVSNKTKVKAIKNKMSPPYRTSEFEVLYGKGIDKMGEIIQLASDFEVIKKYGKTITLLDNGAGGETKYTEEEFKSYLTTSKDFVYSITSKIKDKIQNSDIPVEEPLEKEE